MCNHSFNYSGYPLEEDFDLFNEECGVWDEYDPVDDMYQAYLDGEDVFDEWQRELDQDEAFAEIQRSHEEVCMYTVVGRKLEKSIQAMTPNQLDDWLNVQRNRE